LGTFFLWSTSKNIQPREALDVLALTLGLSSPKPKMVWIPAPEVEIFWMGSKKENDPNAQGREVKMASFCIGKYEVTFEEYDLFANVTGRQRAVSMWGRGRQPVINVSWEDAVAYAAWLKEVTEQDYHLPTEAEWEYAARAGSTTVYSFGDDPGQLGEYAWYGDNADGKTHPVGEKKPNQWGLHDMHGNVWEWTCSAYREQEQYDGSESQCASPNEGGHRVLRGGGWINDGQGLRSADRLWYAPGSRSDGIGFRLARGQTGSQPECEPEAKQ
jgi:formylglycine-generating enzyme required for sulfatase activity